MRMPVPMCSAQGPQERTPVVLELGHGGGSGCGWMCAE